MPDDGLEARVAEALSVVPVDAERSLWIKMGMAVHEGLGPSGFVVWDAWSSQSAHYKPKDVLTAWRRFKSGRGVTLGTLFHTAKEHGWVGEPVDPAASTRVRHKGEGGARA